MLLIKSDLKWCIHLSRSLFLYFVYLQVTKHIYNCCNFTVAKRMINLSTVVAFYVKYTLDHAFFPFKHFYLLESTAFLSYEAHTRAKCSYALLTFDVKGSRHVLVQDKKNSMVVKLVGFYLKSYSCSNLFLSQKPRTAWYRVRYFVLRKCKSYHN